LANQLQSIDLTESVRKNAPVRISAACETFPEDCMSAIVSDDWRQLAEAARDEQDPAKLRQLVEQLNRELKERAENLLPRPSENLD
jgi:hypothetical protein